MRLASFCLAAVACAAIACAAWGADFEERWVYVSTSLAAQDSTDQLVDLLKKSKGAGVTHILLGDSLTANLPSAPAAYRDHVAQVRKAADDLGIKLVLNVFPTGYGGRYLGRDQNVAAGLPAKDMPFIVKGDEARPDPANVPNVLNTGFEDYSGNAFTGWKTDQPGVKAFVCTALAHSGKASLRIDNLDQYTGDGNSVYVRQTVKVKPFQHYRLSVWTKSQDLEAEGEAYLVITSSGGKRRNTYMNLNIEPTTADWTRHIINFNTLEADSIDLALGVGAATKGRIWYDDLEITPAGLLNVLRGETKPVTVTSADGRTVYAEGKDFAEIKDPNMNVDDYTHADPPVSIRPGSRIKDGDTILVLVLPPNHDLLRPGRRFAR